MKVSIHAADSTVYVDGQPMKVDCSELPSWLHAIQWDGNKGQLEIQGHPNVDISSIDPFYYLVERWEKERDLLEAKKKESDAQAAKVLADAEARRVANAEKSRVAQLIAEQGDGPTAAKGS